MHYYTHCVSKSRNKRNFFFVEPVSETAPKNGAIIATISEPAELLTPR